MTESQKAFEAWRDRQPWYVISKPDPDDREDDGATHRLMNIAAHEAWTASRAAALEEAAQACEAEAARVLSRQGLQRDDLPNIMLRQVARLGCEACAHDIRSLRDADKGKDLKT